MVKQWTRETVETPSLEIYIHNYREQGSGQSDLTSELGLTSKFVLLLAGVCTWLLLKQPSNLSCSMNLRFCNERRLFQDYCFLDFIFVSVLGKQTVT